MSSMTYTVPAYSAGDSRGEFASLRLVGNAGVLHGASRLASVSCACAAARLCAAVPEIADSVKSCQEVRKKNLSCYSGRPNMCTVTKVC